MLAGLPRRTLRDTTVINNETSSGSELSREFDVDTLDLGKHRGAEETRVEKALDKTVSGRQHVYRVDPRHVRTSVCQ